MFSPLVNPANAAAVTTAATSSSQYMEMISQIITAFKAGSFSQSSSALTNLALSTPPIAYFLALLSAGIGMPVSEDALCIFCGSILTSIPTAEQRWKLILSLYLGVVISDNCLNFIHKKKVVISDVVTYYIGLGLRLGILKPLKKFIKVTDDVEEAGTTTQTKPVRVRKRDKVKKVLEKSGNRVGFVTRLSVGFRGPLIFLTGYSNRVSIQNFLVGTSFGGIVSLLIQLFIGFSMSQSFKAKGMRDIGSRASKTMTTAAATTTMEGGEGLNVGVGLIGLRNLVLFSVVGVSTFLIQKYLLTNPSASSDGEDEKVVGEE
eukprot:CAMPEP_0178967416 /NCGR_PEP_ID=MMETSP0789-20121207/17582_1 /TAXON_ID=3005 /ORGANISM="Rhizosolenia setigera, Strain CCMP 1694" /LENGTH=317 /DNA_ID=CAMNT_0020653023 /DNA_START=395 /DNA_END=1348 /DNA_ORIENTATION=-